MPSGIYQRKPKNLVTKKCQCGKLFQVWPYRDKTAIYCSTSCLGKYANKYSDKRPPQRWHKSICIICSKQFVIEKWRLKESYRGKFCSLDCRSKRKGKLGANWQGGLSDINPKKRLSWQYNTLKRDLINTKPYCVVCKKNNKLTLDHIVPIAIAPERIYDSTNVQLLCWDCHKIKTYFDIKDIVSARRRQNGSIL